MTSAANRKVVYADYVTEPYKFAVFMDDDTFVQGDTEEDITIEDRNTKGQEHQAQKGLQGKGVLVVEVFEVGHEIFFELTKKISVI